MAYDIELRREVALKQIQVRYADHRESRSRFIMEAKITGNLEHPGIVPVYGLGTDANGRPFYAMRLIRGCSFREPIDDFHNADRLGQGPSQRMLEFRKLLSRFVAVCNTIAYAHSRGVLYRDLKPENILLGQYGETLVVDWGLAKRLGAPLTPSDSNEQPMRPPQSDEMAETMPGSVVGTPLFMSPEQAAGRLDRVGPASDIYSLGATLYYMLTGREPFEKSDVQGLLAKVAAGDFPAPRTVNAAVPADLERICLKAISLRPEDRYPGVRALIDDLEQWLADDQLGGTPDGRRMQLTRALDRVDRELGVEDDNG